MKKHFLAALLAIITCLAAVSGCSLVTSLEKDLQVICEVDGKYYGCYTVNIFNNAVVEEPAAPKGYYFKGWTATPEWTKEEIKDLSVLENTGLIRYGDVKDMVEDGRESVTLYGVFDEIARHDLKIAWWSKSTSGITETDMEGFQNKLYAYLTEQGYKPAEMDLVIKNYGTDDVGTTCGAIMKDGDVDIMLGWAATSNLTGTGGMPAEDILENVGKIQIGSKARYAARLSDSELCRLVYIWIQNEYGEGYTPPVEPPVTPPENPDTPSTKEQLVIAYYNNSSDASGISAENMAEFKTNLEAYLATQNYTTDKLDVVVRDYIGSVKNTCDAVKAAGDVDIMVGWNDKITDNGFVEGTDFIENVSGITVGTKSRYSARITDTSLTRLAFAWIQTTYGEAPVTPPENPDTPEPPVNPSEQSKLVIGWWTSSKSGLNQAAIDRVVEAVKTYLAGQGYGNLEVVVRSYDATAVADVATAVEADGDVQIMLGMKAFAVESEAINNVQMGTVTDRRIHLVTANKNDLSNTVFEWFKTADAQALLV